MPRSLDAMDEQVGGWNGGAGLMFSLRFDPMRAGFDRALVSFPVSALISRLLGWGKNRSSQGKPQGSVMVAAAAVALYVAALFVSDQQPRRRRRRLAASAAARPTSATRPRALPAPDDGLRILSSNDGHPENVIHGASIGAGDDEPVVVARVQTMPPEVAGTTETEHDQLEKEEEDEEVRRFKELWLSLVEREQRLELREMDLDGLREHQEAAVKELENRVGVAAVEARLLELKVLSLREENEQLKAQAAELEAVRVQLGRAKEKLWALTERVQAEREEARSEAAALRDKVTELEKAMAGLEEENGELARRLQDAEQVASAVISLVHEGDIVDERHAVGHGSDQELDLPLSDKAKELMLHYGSLGLYGYDPAIFSPLNESLYGDGESHQRRRVGGHDEPGRSPAMPSPAENRAGHGKRKFLRNIKKLLASSRRSHGHGHGRKSKKAATDDDELEKAMRLPWLSPSSHDALGLGGDSSYESTPLSSCERTPLRSVTAVDLHARRARGGEAAAAAPSASRPEAGAQLARSKSDLGASVRREATRYHALRPESPAVVGTYGGYHSPEKIRTYSDELRSS